MNMRVRNNDKESLLITATGMGEASLFLEMGVRRAKRNLLFLEETDKVVRPPGAHLLPGYSWGTCRKFQVVPLSRPLKFCLFIIFPSCLCPLPASIPTMSQSEGKYEESREGRVLPAPHQVSPLQLEVCSVAFLHLD